MYEIIFKRQYATVSRLYTQSQYSEMKLYALEMQLQGFTYKYTYKKEVI